MSKKQVEKKVKILNTFYNRELNLFKILSLDLETGKEAKLVWRGTDLGVTPDVPQEIIDEFCKNMTGKEKNLFIKIEEEEIDVNNIKNIPEERLQEYNQSFNSYPLQEIILEESQKRDED
jgi:hypothetical protein